jgi:hypothetical protein
MYHPSQLLLYLCMSMSYRGSSAAWRVINGTFALSTSAPSCLIIENHMEMVTYLSATQRDHQFQHIDMNDGLHMHV